MSVAPGLTISGVMKPGRPMAATRMSAWRVISAQVAGLRVADRHGRVLVEQQHRDGLAHDVAAAHDHCVLAGDGNAAALENLDDSGGRAGRERRPAGQQTACIHGMKAVDVLGGIDGVEQGLGIDLRGQRQLDQNAVDLVAPVELGDELEHLLGGDGGRRRDEVAIDAKLGAGLHLVADVDLRRGHVAHQHRSQPRPNAVRGQRADLFGHFLLDGCGNGRAIENLRHLVLQSSWYRFVRVGGACTGGSACPGC